LYYTRAHRAEVNVPAPADGAKLVAQGDYSAQVLALADSLQETGPNLRLPKRFDADLAALDGRATAKQTEAAIAALGEYLGVQARRPDNELGTGPDILWLGPGGPAVVIEAKTGKKAVTVYRKDDIGQLRDHNQWVRTQVGETEMLSVFVGPIAPASEDSNPDASILVLELDALRDLRDRLRAALVDIANSAVPITSSMTAHDIISSRRLCWPEVVKDLPLRRLIDISSDVPF
jgi:hypothetical protein